jgi:hypothetical protein
MAKGLSGSSPTGVLCVVPGATTSPPTTTLGSFGDVPTSGWSVIHFEFVSFEYVVEALTGAMAVRPIV